MEGTRKAEATATPEVVDRARFQRELDELGPREKVHTREGDAIAAARRRLPMREVTKAELREFVTESWRLRAPRKLVAAFDAHQQRSRSCIELRCRPVSHIAGSAVAGTGCSQ